MSHNRKTYTPRNLQTYTSEQLEIIDERETSNSNWDLNWSNIGLNWIDLDERAAHIYSIYMRILDKYINILESHLQGNDNDKDFYIKLFSKCTNEIVYCLLHKHSNKRNEEYRRYEFFNPSQFSGTCTFYEIFVSYLTSCLKCNKELKSAHRSAVDLECESCKTPHEVKSKENLKYPFNLHTGAVRGINELSQSGFLIIITKNCPNLLRIRDSTLREARNIMVTLPDREESLENFRRTLAEYPEETFRHFKTTLRVDNQDLEIIPLKEDNKKKILGLRENLEINQRIFTDIIFEFEKEFITEIEREIGITITMEDNKKFLCETVKLINERNFIDYKNISRAMTDLFANMAREIDIRTRPELSGFSHKDQDERICRIPLESDQSDTTRRWGQSSRDSGAAARPWGPSSRDSGFYKKWGSSKGGNIDNLTLNEKNYKKKYLKYKYKYIQLKLNNL